MASAEKNQINFLHPTFEVAVQSGIVSAEQRDFSVQSQSYMLAVSRVQNKPAINASNPAEIKAFNQAVRDHKAGTDFEYKGVKIDSDALQKASYAIADDYNNFVARKYDLPEIPIPAGAQYDKVSFKKEKGFYALSGKIADAEGYWTQEAKDSILLAQNGARASNLAERAGDDIGNQAPMSAEDQTKTRTAIERNNEIIDKISKTDDKSKDLQIALLQQENTASELKLAKGAGADVPQSDIDNVVSASQKIAADSFNAAGEEATKIPDGKGAAILSAIEQLKSGKEVKQDHQGSLEATKQYLLADGKTGQMLRPYQKNAPKEVIAEAQGAIFDALKEVNIPDAERKKLGLDNRDTFADGAYGDKTQQAVRLYEKENGMKETGVIGPDVYSQLTGGDKDKWPEEFKEPFKMQLLKKEAAVEPLAGAQQGQEVKTDGGMPVPTAGERPRTSPHK